MRELCLSGIDKSDLKGIATLLESNGDIFEKSVMSYYRGEREYEYQSHTFEVKNIDEESIEFAVDVHFYAGCKDMSDLMQRRGCVGYTISNNIISIDTDETDWILDN